MSLIGQRLQEDRYSIIPRTLIFLLSSDEVLLLRLGEGRGQWAGKFNGLGGHLEQGEEPLSAARREIREETGLSPEQLQLCGVVVIDTGGTPGIGLYVFVGEVDVKQDLQAGPEGEPCWVSMETLNPMGLVEDLPVLLPQAIRAYSKGVPFSARYTYDSSGKLDIIFGK